MSKFRFSPGESVPFRDLKAIERCRKIKRSQIDKHKNPEFKIRVLRDADVEFTWVTDMLGRMKQASDEGRKFVMIMPNPVPSYRHVARLINTLKVDCSKIIFFAMDEYANEDGEIAPESWEFGFGHALKKHMVFKIDEKLRMPEKNVHLFTNKNIKDYGKMIADHGGADACYSGPGWTGHLAFIEPDAPEFDLPLAEWKKCGPRIVTLSPFTLAQNSLYGGFGMSGDLAAVPPKAATIGPAEVIGAKHRMDVSALGIHGTATSWQRLVARMCYHGPVTPKLPTSIHQLLDSNAIMSETIARNIEPDWEKEY
jgi:6-phosphogluconolactonase/glucosamine-6-phosphate isomerase/deaminase